MSDEDLSLCLPPPPPRSSDERLYWLRLLRSYRVGPATFYRLMEEYGSAATALTALPEVARQAGVTAPYRPFSEDQARAELRAGRIAGAKLIALGEPDYPLAMAALSDPPPLLWALGDLTLLNRSAVALVGTRQATSLGTRMARTLAEDLGRAGQVIASGLARGVDAAAHLGSLASGTIAVMAGGVDVIYPAENAALAGEIAARGLRISDQPMGLEPQARHFARRNRLIAGLAQVVVVVVEAPARSGALITAREALEAGREVMAVPGHPMDSRVSGCNQLIRDGATLVRSASDVLEALSSAQSFLQAEEISGSGSHLAPAKAETRVQRDGCPASPPSRAASAAQVLPQAPPAPAQLTQSRHAPVTDPLPRIQSEAGPPRAGRPAPLAPIALARGHQSAAAQSVLPYAIIEQARVSLPAHTAANDAPPKAEDRRPPRLVAQRAAQASTAASLIEPRISPRRGGALPERLRAPALPERILECLSLSPLSEDQLIRDLGLSAGEIGSELVALELDGRIERRPGGYLSRRP